MVEVRVLDKDSNSNNKVGNTKGPDPRTKVRLIVMYVEPRVTMLVNARPERDND